MKPLQFHQNSMKLLQRQILASGPPLLLLTAYLVTVLYSSNQKKRTAFFAVKSAPGCATRRVAASSIYSPPMAHSNHPSIPLLIQSLFSPSHASSSQRLVLHYKHRSPLSSVRRASVVFEICLLVGLHYSVDLVVFGPSNHVSVIELNLM